MAMAYATVSFAFLDLSQSEAGIALGANAADTPEIVAGAALQGVALAWYGPAALLARLNGWYFSFVWRYNEMTMHEEEASVEQG